MSEKNPRYLLKPETVGPGEYETFGERKFTQKAGRQYNFTTVSQTISEIMRLLEAGDVNEAKNISWWLNDNYEKLDQDMNRANMDQYLKHIRNLLNDFTLFTKLFP